MAADAIGSVRWGMGGSARSATLHPDGTWTTAGPDAWPGLAGSLEAAYADHYRGPQDGPYGPAILADLARWTRGVVTLEPTRPTGPGVVY